ncbi:unnamed protein product [Mesocestoides corti]|uniref:Eukaryotic translation initiation factor 4E binding protein n=1 Tax=Mesocestoides corti TaxID=53468 RepID=A0A0R3ULU0_MESCO|nr:unnamed protein product [Mesocestoides corti]
MESNNKDSGAVPFRRIKVTDPSQIPQDYSTTPGGSIFSTTPGGTHLYYDRDTMLLYKNSPIARSPPANVFCMPGVICPPTCTGGCNLPAPQKKTEDSPKESVEKPNDGSGHKGDDATFDLDL